MRSILTILAAIAACAMPWAISNQTQTESQSASVDLCVAPARGPIRALPSNGANSENATGIAPSTAPTAPTARVGKPAPDFEANAYVDGGFKPVKLSDFKGKWVVLCFYPGDFTFV